MAKRMTKANREAAEKQMLYNRLLDFAIGANGGFFPDIIDGKYQLWSMGAAAFGRFLFCIDRQLLPDWRDHLVYNFENFDTLESAVDYLFRNGVRHDSTPDDQLA